MTKETNRNTSIQSIQTRSYSDIRKLIRHAYMYGTFSDSDYIDMGVINTKIRQLAYMWSNISTYFKMNKPDETVIYNNKNPNRKKNKISRRIFIDSFLQDGSFIASTYKHFSLTKNDLLYYLFFLFSFGNTVDENPYGNNETSVESKLKSITYEESFDREDIYDTMETLWFENGAILNGESEVNTDLLEVSDKPFSRTTLNHFLEELSEQGLLIRKNVDSKIYYRLPLDVLGLSKFTLNTYSDMLDDLLSANQFFCNVMPLVVPGYYINDKLDIMKKRVITTVENKLPNNSFHFSKINHQNIVDDDIVWSLLEYIDSHKPVSYSYGVNVEKKSNHNVLPMKIVEDNVYGRHYLFGYGYAQKSCILHRIDYIDNVIDYECSKVIPSTLGKYSRSCNNDIIAIKNDFCDYHLRFSWNVTPFIGKLYPISIVFDFSKCTSLLRKHLLEKLYRNPLGTECIIKQDEDHMLLRGEISSQEEIIPWLHSFACYAIVDKVICPQLYEIVKKQSMELAQLYEII